MSIVNIDDVQYVPSNEPVQTQPSNDGVIINQPLLSYAPDDTLAIENSSQYLMMSSSNCENSEIMPITVVHNHRNDSYSSSGNIDDIHNYTIWTYFNLIFCFPCVGIVASLMCSKTKTKKRRGNHRGAQIYSNLTAIMNIVGTLSGILIFIIGGLRLFGYIIPSSPPHRE